MTAWASRAGNPGTAGTSRAAGRGAEVCWFDTREITLGPADLASLDAREAARAAAFVFPADRHRYQVAHVMLRRVLAARLGTEPGTVTFGRQPCPACGGPSGRPVLAGRAPGGTAPPGGHPQPPDGPGEPLSFSLAHSGEAVAIAVARDPVGIDVERQPSGCVCSLASAMHADDAGLVAALPEPDRHLAVIRWWVRAEAVLKCAGTGIAHGMDAFPVLGPPALDAPVLDAPAPGTPAPSASARSGVPRPRPPVTPGSTRWATVAGCSFTALPAPEGYHAALALPGPGQVSYGRGSGGW